MPRNRNFKRLPETMLESAQDPATYIKEDGVEISTCAACGIESTVAKMHCRLGSNGVKIVSKPLCGKCSFDFARSSDPIAITGLIKEQKLAIQQTK